MVPTTPGRMLLPVGMRADGLAALEEGVLAGLESNYLNGLWLSERAILAPLNDTAHSLNERMLNKLPGRCRSFTAIDTVVVPAEAIDCPVAFINSLSPAGLPPHRINIKVGVPVILLKNVDLPRLCNGTRLMVTGIHADLLEAEIMGGEYSGDSVILPKIKFRADVPTVYTRVEFRLACHSP